MVVPGVAGAINSRPSFGHRRTSSQGSGSLHHRSASGGGRRHRRTSSYDTGGRSRSSSKSGNLHRRNETFGGFAGLKLPASSTPRGAGRKHRRGGSSDNFGSNKSFKGIADQFKQYQKETIQRTRIHKERADPEHETDGCDDCCTYCVIPCFCVVGWLCCANCSHGDESAVDGEPRNTPSSQRFKKIDPIHRVIQQGGAPTGNQWLGIIPAVCYSILLLIILLSMSSTTKFINESQRTWTLNQGETRQVPIPVIFNKAIKISTQSDDGGGVNVFNINGDCPSLTGPRLFLENGPHNLRMDEGDYQYDFFWLNEGSKIHIDVTQLQGSSIVHILMGEQVLARLANENHDYAYDGGFKSSLVKQYVTGPKLDGQTSATLEYTALHSDTYIILYENNSGDESIISALKGGEKSVASVHYEITLASYDLQAYAPICKVHSDTEADDDSTIDVDVCVIAHASMAHGEGCLLVKATTDQTGDTSTVSTINVNESRRWVPLIFCSMIPIFIVLLIRFGSDWYRRNMDAWYSADYMEAAAVPSPKPLSVPTSPDTDVADIFAAATAGEADGLLHFTSSLPPTDYNSVPLGNHKDAVAVPIPRLGV